MINKSYIYIYTQRKNKIKGEEREREREGEGGREGDREGGREIGRTRESELEQKKFKMHKLCVKNVKDGGDFVSV